MYSCINTSLLITSGFPHSDIHGSLIICISPWLFAAYHVFLRLLVPRHSPYALTSLTYFLPFSRIFMLLLLSMLVTITLYIFQCAYVEYALLTPNFNGGPDRNRTCDLTLIRRAL